MSDEQPDLQTMQVLPPKKSAKDKLFDLHKSEIYKVYSSQDKSLEETISIIEEKHGFIAKYVSSATLSPAH